MRSIPSWQKNFKDDVFECLHHITDFKKLKSGVIFLHKKYVKEEMKKEGGDTDFTQQYSQQRKYLENNVNYLRTMLQKDQDVHKKENSKIMTENVQLLQEINDQRKECHALRQKIRHNELQIQELGMGGAGGLDGQGGMFEGDIGRELKMQDLQIEELHRQINEVEQQNELLRQRRPAVGQPLPLDQNDQY